ncbi:MAG: hypothetical protein WDO69_34265 [Pseudomonadota bacterium]
MSVTSKTRSHLTCALLLCGLASGSVVGCAVFGSHGDSTVAQGKYYASGDPYYDQFFVDLYLLQVGMVEAPQIPQAELQRLTQLLQLEPPVTPAMIELSLHEEALKLSRAGVHLRLDQNLATGAPADARTTIRSNARPKENPAAALLANVETSSTNLLRFLSAMKQKEEALGQLDQLTIRLDAGVDRAFSQSPVGKISEVKRNLADAHKLIPLMRARAEQLRTSTEQLLAALTHGIDTDDGSIGPPITAEPLKGESAHEPDAASDASKKAAGKPHPKAKPASAAPAPRTKPSEAAADSDAPAKPRAAPAKAAAPPRDFEP